MKLSMWMIANRLTDLDMDIQIRETAAPVLNSARRAYATNCVHVYSEGNDCICNGDGDCIRISNMDVRQGFEIIQSVFDYFNDWDEEIMKAIRKKDFQLVVDLCYQVFQNPLVLFNGNNYVLGITRQFPADSLDAEWYYLSNYGHTSLNSLQYMKYNYNNLNSYSHTAQTFAYEGNKRMAFGGMVFPMTCEDIHCGTLTLLSKTRPLNPGDGQLLRYLVNLLEPVLGQTHQAHAISNTNVFYNLLFNRNYDQSQLLLQLEYQQWLPSGEFHLMIAKVKDESSRDVLNGNADLIGHVLSTHFKDCIVVKKLPYVVVVSNRDLREDPGSDNFFRNLQLHNSLDIAFSLPIRGIQKVNHLCKQAMYSLQAGKNEGEKHIFDFYENAIDYIMESDSLDCSLHACMPEVLKLWEGDANNKDELIHTLKIYLDNERSVTKTASALFTHRNTVQYRIRKIQELLNHDLEDPYVRYYARISIHIIEMYEKKHAYLT